MKTKFLISLMLVTTCLFSQVSNSYIPMKSAGGHTYYQPTAETGNIWTWSTISSDTISNRDTCRGLFLIGSNKAAGTGAVKPNIVTDSIEVFGSWKSGSIQITITKVSGTVVDTSWLQVSDNGVNWIASGQDTAIFSNVSYTQTYIWEIPGRLRKTNSGVWNSANTVVNAPYQGYNQVPGDMPYQFYRVVTSGTGGTQSAVIKCFLLKRQGP